MASTTATIGIIKTTMYEGMLAQRDTMARGESSRARKSAMKTPIEPHRISDACTMQIIGVAVVVVEKSSQGDASTSRPPAANGKVHNAAA